MTIELVGQATGPERFVPELGCKVKTFTQVQKKQLKWHVPLEFRGDYRPNQLANYDPNKEYRCDPWGYVLCYGWTKAGERCNKRAVNRYPRCVMHGGALNSFDQVKKDEKPTPTTRYKQFLDGIITVEDLDDEELATCGFRASDGRIYKPKNVPREITQAFTKAIYERAQEALRALTVDAANTVGEIMKNKTNEPDIRLKAALSLLERNLGKTPTNLVVTQDKPFEMVFDAISTKRPETIDGEVVGERSIVDAAIERSTLPNDFDSESVGERRTEDLLDSQARRHSAEVKSALHSRNEAVLAQFVEIKPYEYSVEDNRQAIQQATKKRYATRDIPLIREETRLPDGGRIIRHILPKQPTKKQIQNRKRYTLDDF